VLSSLQYCSTPLHRELKNNSILHKAKNHRNPAEMLLVTLTSRIFNAAMFTGYFPAQWKVAKITLRLKPGKFPNKPTGQ
jgi:hypothetical protein